MLLSSPFKFLENASRVLFFTGKGGVGKTSIACASAILLADRGKRVLLISTDPASNLDEVLGISLVSSPVAIPRVPGLWALNLNPEQAAAQYREKMIGPYRGTLPDTAIRSIEEQLSGSCTVEIAAFDEFARLLGDPGTTADFDHVLFDTAPTGHTLRLLTLPSAWSGFVEHSTTGTSCLGPLAGLQAQQTLYKNTVTTLSDPHHTTLVLVSRAEKSALNEAARTSRELKELDVSNQQLVVNGVFCAQDREDSIALAFENRGALALEGIPENLKQLPTSFIPLRPGGAVGIEALRDIASSNTAIDRENITIKAPPLPDSTPLFALVDEIVAGQHGVVLTMGKGGVGKTTIASAIAVEIASRGFPVHLSTTDPAAHVLAALNEETLPTLTVSRIDPVAETARYSEEVLARSGATLDAAGKALLEEDLRSPCTAEIAVFRAFAEAVAEGKNSFVVLDTAPTGHTILLLDSALAYHREVARQSSQISDAIKNLLPRLRDPNFTRIIIVTLPEATPVHEAAMLQRDLRRAEIEPFAWVINQSFGPLMVKDPLLVQRQAHEAVFVEEVLRTHLHTHNRRVSIIPWQTKPPVGISELKKLTAPIGRL